MKKAPLKSREGGKVLVTDFLFQILGSWGSEATLLATPFFKKADKISHTPGLWAFWDALPSFASLSQSAKNEFSKSIFYVKNHPNLSQFFFHWRIQI